MTDTSEIEIGVASSLIASAVTYVGAVVLSLRLPTLSYLVFWRRFCQDLIILVSEVPMEFDPDARPGEQPPLTPLGDAIVLGDFLRFLKRRLRAAPTVVSAQTPEVFDRFKHHNLLIIGGPKYNNSAKTLLLELDRRLPYQFKRLRPVVHTPYEVKDIHLKRFVGRDDSDPEFVSAPDDERDYACAVMARNPYNSDRRVLLVGGLSTLATLGAADWLQRSRPTVWLRSRFRRDGFEAIVSCRTSATTRVSGVKTEALSYLNKEK